eukprot:1246879-Rhodomonas_salina.1
MSYSKPISHAHRARSRSAYPTSIPYDVVLRATRPVSPTVCLYGTLVPHPLYRCLRQYHWREAVLPSHLSSLYEECVILELIWVDTGDTGYGRLYYSRRERPYAPGARLRYRNAWQIRVGNTRNSPRQYTRSRVRRRQRACDTAHAREIRHTRVCTHAASAVLKRELPNRRSRSSGGSRRRRREGRREREAEKGL